MSGRIARTRMAAAAVSLLSLATLPALAAARPSVRAHVARGCSVGSGHGYGYSYLTSLRVSHTSCATGRVIARHHGRVRGWSCTRRRLDSSPVQYDERVSCRSGRRQVVWTYTENT
jgi:hypothetical protein